MSRKLIIDAGLDEYEGPVTTEAVTTQIGIIMDIFEQDGVSVCGHFLKEIYSNILGFQEQFRPQTTDGYTWFWGHRFARGTGYTRGKGYICILHPWKQYRKSTDRSQYDRAGSIYARSSVSTEDIMLLLREITDTVRTAVARF